MISITQLENKYHTNYTIFNDINIIINFINYNNKTVSSATSHQCSTHITKQYTAGNLGENGTSDLAGNQGDQNEHVFQHMYLVITIAYYVLIMIVGMSHCHPVCVRARGMLVVFHSALRFCAQ
uniref:Uncharacterized protein n=1 Tax=Cacopsylla melanoneura TaxID=428564 RepID=A0A8D8QE44_9HEMI